MRGVELQWEYTIWVSRGTSKEDAYNRKRSKAFRATLEIGHREVNVTICLARQCSGQHTNKRASVLEFNAFSSISLARKYVRRQKFSSALWSTTNREIGSKECGRLIDLQSHQNSKKSSS